MSDKHGKSGNDWLKIVIVALMAGSVGPTGSSLLGKQAHNPGPIVVTTSQWTELNREVAALTAEVRGMKTTLDNLATRLPQP